MGNKFGNFATEQAAIDDLIADGFCLSSSDGVYKKASRTCGSLFEAPRECSELVEITSYTVDGKWAIDGNDYKVYQHHYL